jgi:Rrf2 family nitric oxide-sensitive transcriptional repressor
MQLTVFTDYGLRSLMYLAAHPERRCSVREIAEYYEISRHHLVKVVHRLSQLGYISSNKGRGGGIQIAKPAGELKLGDLVEALEPSMEIVECFNKHTNTCRIAAGCQLKHYIFDAKKAFLISLNSRTLADTVKNKSLFMTTNTYK